MTGTLQFQDSVCLVPVSLLLHCHYLSSFDIKVNEFNKASLIYTQACQFQQITQFATALLSVCVCVHVCVRVHACALSEVIGNIL